MTQTGSAPTLGDVPEGPAPPVGVDAGSGVTTTEAPATPPASVRPAAPPVVVSGRWSTARSRWESRYVAMIVGADALVAGVAALLGVLLTGLGDETGYWVAAAAFPFAWVAALGLGRAYEARFLGVGGEEYRRVFDSAVRLLAAVAVVLVAAQVDVARSAIVVVFPLGGALTLLARYAARRVLSRLRRQGRCRARVVIVGRERSVSEMIRKLARGQMYSVVGVCVDRSRGTKVDGFDILGRTDQVVDALQASSADTVAVAAWSDLSQEDMRRLSWELEGTGVDLLVEPRLAEIAGPRVHVRPEAGVPLLHIDEPYFSGPRKAVKGLFDRSLALAAVLALSPVLIGISMAIRFDSKGPALFRQTRVGADGREFTIYKFRTMRVGADAEVAELAAQNEAADGLLFKMRADPRITRVGAPLRKYSLDELPQLFNVLLGSMSLVGPRPPLPSEVEQYDGTVRRRLLVKPGVTGLWQVSGRSDLSWDESVRLDLSYVENWSIPLDLVIMWRTLGAVLRGRGAY